MGGGWGLHGLDEEDCERKSKGRRGDDCKLMGGGGGGGGGEREERHREFRAQQAHLIINFAKRGRLEMEGCKSVKEEEETTKLRDSRCSGQNGAQLINFATLGPTAPNTQPSKKNKNQSSAAKVGRKAH